MATARALALVDGEHYPAVTRWALATARAEGYEVVAALLVGGTEKLDATGHLDLGEVPVEQGGSDAAAMLRQAIERHRPDVVLDLSDEPILDDATRMLLASVTLAAGVRYVTPDASLDPPIDAAPLEVPTLAVIGSGKRTGKTAVAGEAARTAERAGLDPVVVAMGRGGPPGPQVIEAGTLTLERLVELARSGEHAASDYLEDALTTGVTTIGARRAGGGLGGRPYVTNIREAAVLAEASRPGLVILEGSGAAIPPVPWDAGVLVTRPASAGRDPAGSVLPVRVLLSDLVVFTIETGPQVGPQDLSDLESHVRRLRPGARTVVVEFRPEPLGEVEGKKVLFATTAPETAGPALISSLQERHRCTVVAATHRLGDRAALAEDLQAAPPYEVLLTELKAAAVDVAADQAMARGADVVFCDNRAETLGGDGELPELLEEVARLAVERRSVR
jgi:cyclic 2,3-diphosphoglycerate synthetase